MAQSPRGTRRDKTLPAFSGSSRGGAALMDQECCVGQCSCSFPYFPSIPDSALSSCQFSSLPSFLLIPDACLGCWIHSLPTDLHSLALKITCPADGGGLFGKSCFLLFASLQATDAEQPREPSGSNLQSELREMPHLGSSF